MHAQQSDQKPIEPAGNCDRFLSDGCPHGPALAHTQRLQTLGLMVGEVAHDLNNMLSMALGQLELLLMGGGLAEEQIEQIAEIRNAVSNAGGVCRSMLRYAGKASAVDSDIVTSRFFQELRKFFEVARPKKVEFLFESDPDLPSLRGDANQLRQIFLNLLMNASEAIGDNPGRIVLRLASVVRPDLTRSDCRCVHVTVSDTGCGMSSETLSKLFDPFYTTKSNGRGLGLASVKQLVESMHGSIGVTSTLGKGTDFDVVLPGGACNVCAGVGESCDLGMMSWDKPLCGTVLLVDDEETLRRIGEDGLKRMGLNVLTARNGAEAVDCFDRCGSDIDLILMDAVMPKMDGCEALRAIRSRDEDACVVLVSGYAETDLGKRLNGVEPDGLLLKPVPFDLLRQTVMRFLNKETQDVS